MDRLTVVDEIFLRTHRGMGTPIALQGLWRTPDAMEPALLRAIHDRLRSGRLGRRVVNPRVPGARRAWHPNTTAHPLDLLPNHTEIAETDWPATPIAHDSGHCAGPLPAHAILAWADRLGTDLDPEFAPGWRLSAARLEDGGTVVALTCSHALADARGLIHAVTVALRSLDPAHDASNGLLPVCETRCRTTSSEWKDASSQWATIVGGTARALFRKLPRRSARPTTDHVAREPGVSNAPPLNPGSPGDRHPHPLLLSFDATHWDITASTLGGTPNSLFIHVIANILWQNGFPNPVITASLPVDTRDEPRVDNDLAMTEIAIHRTDTPATIRDRARSAYQRRMSSPAGLPEEILQVIPDRWAYTLSKGAGERDILCSNIGSLPDAVRRVGPHDCTRVAARAIHPGITDFPRTQLAGYLSQLRDTYTLALVSLAADNDSLPDAVDKACAAIGLHPATW
ncbi:hypothetical protein [Nocardia sp. NPDC060249]|uniref:hypothetical protein n=1 Tax=Nocardia sp. NPDC060249 TaxID=3347082 RepID=UPI00364C3C64